MPLKSETRTPPCGWIYFQPESGWRPAKNLTTLNQVASSLRKHRLANPHLQLNPDLAACKEDINNYVCAFLKNDPAWCVVPPGETPKKSSATRDPQPARVASDVGAVESARRVAAGARILYDWLGSGGKEVPREQARQRAAICRSCPNNQKGDWKRFFTGPIARTIRSQLAMRSDMNLQTDQDEHIRYCKACGCWLPLKIWVPIQSIAEYTSDAVKADLATGNNCWILSEIFNETCA